MREHFGYADGFAQPSIEGSGVQGRCLGLRSRHQKDGAVGGQSVQASSPRLPRRGGGLRRRRRRPSWRRRTGRTSSTASSTRMSRSSAGACANRPRKPKGRRGAAGGEGRRPGGLRDGTPLELSPDAPDPAIVGDRQRVKRPQYNNDPQGLKCPIGAHTRRVNPRDSLPFDGELVNRHRLIRRWAPATGCRCLPGRRGRRQGPGRAVHHPAGEHRPAVRVRPVAVAPRRGQCPRPR